MEGFFGTITSAQLPLQGHCTTLAGFTGCFNLSPLRQAQHTSLSGKLLISEFLFFGHILDLFPRI